MLMGRFREALKSVPYSKYVASLVRSRYSPSTGWYSWLRDANAKVTRTSFFDLDSIAWYITPTNQRIALESLDDLDTTSDVFMGGHYDRMNREAKPGSVVWDIGANIGAASLIFAQNPNVTHVYSYEPMPHTFSWTQRTLNGNPALSPKIDVQNLGIGSSQRDLEISYTRKAKCAIGLSEIPERLRTRYDIQPEDMEQITIHLADADQVLSAIRSRHPDAPILLKLDAEGAEYEVINRLAETGGLHELAAAAIEWHLEPGKEYLTSRLQSAGFQTAIHELEPDGSIGMIDAWR